MSAPPGFMMVRRRDEHPTALADLHGKRLVVLSETADGDRLDEGTVKALTGGDKIRARRMREDHWEFKPSHLPIIVTNHRPRVRGTDEGIWRRLRLVPFAVTIPKAERDSRLSEKLAEELPGVLAWAVRGCLEWQQSGLAEPESVLQATSQFRESSDSVASWLKEVCDTSNPDGFIRAKEARESYERHCRDNGDQHIGPRKFGEELKRRFEHGRDRGGTFYRGVEIVTSASNPSHDPQ